LAALLLAFTHFQLQRNFIDYVTDSIWHLLQSHLIDGTTMTTTVIESPAKKHQCVAS